MPSRPIAPEISGFVRRRNFTTSDSHRFANGLLRSTHSASQEFKESGDKCTTSSSSLKFCRKSSQSLCHIGKQGALFNIRRFDIIATWERAYAKDGIVGLMPYQATRRERKTPDGDPASLGGEN